jgi:predicted Fe-Mo cluster-binding NifX family protein
MTIRSKMYGKLDHRTILSIQIRGATFVSVQKLSKRTDWFKAVRQGRAHRGGMSFADYSPSLLECFTMPSLSISAGPEQSQVTAVIRMAVASIDGTKVDQHFGQTEAFYVFDVSADGAALIERRVVAQHMIGDEGPRETIARMLHDCKFLLAEKVGPGPRPVLAKAGIEPVDAYAYKAIEPSLAAVFAKQTEHA